ncbi:hypothetical protein K474DRAFT_629852 [Panus rudis PR-1116 ss-1]|nr:hypothetical protein K474DRAFT_629852 [Panus rudis PR-1116 ss-1]
MVDWNSPEEFARELDFFIKMIHVVAGFYFWDYLLSFTFEWSMIFRHKFKWPMVFYSLNRYSALATIVVMLWIVDASPGRQIDCQIPITILQVFFFMSLILSSINLAIRTLAIWSFNRYVTGFLAILLIGQLVIMSFIHIGGQWEPHGIGCAPTEVPNRFIAALHGYPLAFDLVVFILACIKIRIGYIETKSGIAYILFRDGLMYYIVSFLANAVVVTFALLNLNTFMDSMFNIPVGIVVSVAATRAVRNLQIEASKPVQPAITVTFPQSRGTMSDVRFARSAALMESGVYSQGYDMNAEVSDEILHKESLVGHDMV